MRLTKWKSQKDSQNQTIYKNVSQTETHKNYPQKRFTK